MKKTSNCLSRAVLSMSSFVLLTLGAGCAPKVHRHFEANRELSGFSTYIYNPQAGILFRSPGDIDYASKRDALEQALIDVPVNQVLAYGTSNLEPRYELIVLASPRFAKVDLSAFDHVYDTTLGYRRYLFLGKGLQEVFPISDFRQISRSLQRADSLPSGFALDDLLEKYAQSARYLEAFSQIASYPATNPTDRNLQLQLELTYLSMMGDSPLFQERLQQWEGRYALQPGVLQALGESGVFGAEDVKMTLLEHMEGERLVLFSENHFYPWHRQLLLELLPDLRARGFRYLALESLVSDSLLNQGSPPKLSTGFYTREQTYYRMLREARELGFEFVAYEAGPDRPDREMAQAESLYLKTFARDPEAKVVVLAGLDHILEGVDLPNPRMAGHLKIRYGIDPFTISQSDLAHYRTAIGAELALIPSKLLEGERFRQTDLQVINNMPWGFPTGDFHYTNTTEAPVQLVLFDTSGWKSPYAYLTSIPGYSVLVGPGQAFSLNLPHSGFRLLVWDAGGALLQDSAASEGL